MRNVFRKFLPFWNLYYTIHVYYRIKTKAENCMLNSRNILKYAIGYHTAHKFTSSLKLFSRAVREEMTIFYLVEVLSTADSSSVGTMTRKQHVLVRFYWD
jgi:hypothetical protein